MSVFCASVCIPWVQQISFVACAMSCAEKKNINKLENLESKSKWLLYIECSFCRLIRCPRSFLETLIGRQFGSPQQTESHSFGDYLIVQSCATKCYSSFLLFCSVLCLHGSCELQFRTRNFHLWLLCEKLIQIMQETISP
jgi:hypothetical protein